MNHCLICGREISICTSICGDCLSTPVEILEERYQERERASTPAKEEKAPSVSEPRTENTHRQ